MTRYRHVTGKGKIAMSTEREASHIASLVPPPKSSNPLDYTHTRRQFKMMLSDIGALAEIKSKIQIAPQKVKDEFEAFFYDEPVIRWGDPTMIKLRDNLELATEAALEAAWIA